MKIQTKFCGGVLGIAAMTILVACSDSETTNNYDNTAVASYKNERLLPECNKGAEGSMAFVRSDATMRVCFDAEWYVINGEDGKRGPQGEQGEQGDQGEKGVQGDVGESGDNGTGCNVSALKDGSGLKLTCDGDSIGVIKNGEQGDIGDAGEDCVPCTTQALEDDSGYKIICGDETVVTILNGVVKE